MSEAQKVMSKPEGILKVVITICEILGAVAVTPAWLENRSSIRYTIFIALGGGAWAALTCILASDETEYELVELIFSILYGILNLVGGIFMAYLLSDVTFGTNVGTYIVTICLFVAAVCWIIDFALNLRKKL